MHANHQSGGATNAHPSATLPRTRTQTPEEALGINAGSNLMSSCIIATGLTAAVLAVLTVGPYFMGKAGGEKAVQAAPVKPDETPAPVEQPKPDPNATAKKPPTTPDTTKPPKTDVLDKLGETGTKTGNPKVNPLDKGDDLFKDLK